MAYEKTSSGLIFETAFSGVALPSELITGNGDITVGSGVCNVVSDTWTTATYFVYENALPADRIYAIRIKSKANSLPGIGADPPHEWSMGLGVFDNATRLSGIYSQASRNSMLRPNSEISYPDDLIVRWSNSTDLLNGTYPIDTYYIEDIESNATDCTYGYRNLDCSLIASSTKNWDTLDMPLPSDSLWVAMGQITFDGWPSFDTCDWTLDYFQIMKSLSVVVTNIDAGNTVKLYDSSDVEKASATESGTGSVTLDCSTIGDFGFTGYFKVFDGAVELRRLPEAGNFTGEALYGGDEWPGELPVPTITSITLPSEQIGESVTLAGSGFGDDGHPSSVTFNGVEAVWVAAGPPLYGFFYTPTSWSDTEIVLPVPLGASTGDVVVTVNDIESEGKPFTVAAPTLTSITPDTGVNTGSIIITDLEGAGFNTGATVALQLGGEDNIDATDIVVLNSTQITCTFDLTDAEAGDWDVLVVNPDDEEGTLSEGFEITAPPVPSIISVSPARGGKGLRVVIHGLDFADVEGTVYLDDTECEVLEWNDNNVTIRIPELP